MRMQARAAAASHPRRILFIGDSLTYTNNLDERVAALARAAGVAWTSAATEDSCDVCRKLIHMNKQSNKCRLLMIKPVMELSG